MVEPRPLVPGHLGTPTEDEIEDAATIYAVAVAAENEAAKRELLRRIAPTGLRERHLIEWCKGRVER